MASTSAARFVALDSWRGICAILVAIHNLNYGFWLPQAPFVRHSSLFVDFFFVLSGFVITHAYGDKLEDRSGLGSFMLRRIGRLWPLHITMLAALIGLHTLKLIVSGFISLPPDDTPIRDASPAGTLVTNLLLIQVFFRNMELSWNAPSWSISAEMWTYFLFGGVCLFSPKRPPPVVLMGGIALLAAGILALFSPAFLETNTDYAFVRCVFGFFVGHLVYRIWNAGISAPGSYGILEFSAVTLVAAFVFFVGEEPLSLAAPFIFGFAVWVFAHERGPVSTLLTMRSFVYLGTLSYSIYMVHWFVRGVTKGAGMVLIGLMGHGPAGPNWPIDILLVVYLVTVVLLASITFRLIEQPGRRYFNNLSERIFPTSPQIQIR